MLSPRFDASPESRPRRIRMDLLDGFFVVFAAWTIYGQACAFMAVPFATVAWWAWAPLMLGLAAAVAVLPAAELDSDAGAGAEDREPARAAAGGDSGAGRRVASPVILLLGVGLVAARSVAGLHDVFFLGGLVLLGLQWWDAEPLEAPASERVGGPPPMAWTVERVLASALAVFVAACAFRPDSDDGFYLGLVMSFLDDPTVGLFSRDAIFGEPDLPLLAASYRMHAYEVLVAALAWWAGADPWTIYYLWFPVLFAVLAVMAQAEAARVFLGRTAPLVALGLVAILLSWGETHRSFGNFAFVRLFQGKTIVLAVCVPALLVYARRAYEQGGARDHVLLVSASVAATGLSSTGLAIVPVAVGAYLGGVWLARPSFRSVGTLLAATGYLLVLAVIVMAQSEPGSPFRALSISTRSTPQALSNVLGSGLRGDLALLVWLVLPRVPGVAMSSRVRAGWALLLFAAIVNPWLVPALEGALPGLGWRLLWGVPFPLWLTLAVFGLAGASADGRVARSVFAGVALVVFCAPSGQVVSAANRVWFAAPGPKVSGAIQPARAAVERTPEGGAVLAPSEVASWIAILPARPRLVAVRDHYLDVVERGRGPTEARRRQVLQSLVEAPRRRRPARGVVARRTKRIPTLLDVFEELGGRCVVLHPASPWAEPLRGALRARGFRSAESAGYEIWWRADGPSDGSGAMLAPTLHAM